MYYKKGKKNRYLFCFSFDFCKVITSLMAFMKICNMEVPHAYWSTHCQHHHAYLLHKTHIIYVMSLGNKTATSDSFLCVISCSALLRSEIWKASSCKRKSYRGERYCQCAGWNQMRPEANKSSEAWPCRHPHTLHSFQLRQGLMANINHAQIPLPLKDFKITTQ